MKIKAFIKLFPLICMLLVVGQDTNAQEWNYARLSVLYGGSVPFHFNSIKKYTEGIEVLDGTTIGITLADSNQVGHDLEGFDINFRAFNGQTSITGTSYNLDLNKIRIKAENNLGLGSGISNGYQDLAASWTQLFSYTNIPFTNLAWDTHQLSISYECGKPISEGGNGTLMGEPQGFYTVEIEIEIIPTGPGF